MEHMTEQEILNKAWNHARQMKEMARGPITEEDARIGGIGKCFYRAPNGERCLIGAFIPDEQYDSRFENKPIQNLFSSRSTLFVEIGLMPEFLFNNNEKEVDERKKFLVALQHCHDASLTIAEVLDKLRLFAIKHNLTIPHLAVPDQPEGDHV